MLLIYERSHQQTLQVETRFDADTREYVLIIRRPDATEQVERFRDPTSFRRRLTDLEHQLEDEQWQKRSATALPDAWKL
jgi:hypothetical protein